MMKQRRFMKKEKYLKHNNLIRKKEMKNQKQKQIMNILKKMKNMKNLKKQVLLLKKLN